jgi:hypothetical protein
MLCQVAAYGGPEVDDSAEYAALEPPPGENGEEVLDGVEPRGRCRREVEHQARMTPRPLDDLRVLMGGVIVDMDNLSGRHPGLDLIEKADKFLMPGAFACIGR